MDRTLPAVVDHGEIRSTITGHYIAHPTIMFDRTTGTFHGWGEAENMKAKYAAITTKLTQAGIQNDMVLLELDGASKEHAVYVINRAMLYTASGFLERLSARLQQPGFTTWLDAEIARVPVNA